MPSIKRVHNHETIGGLFGEIYMGMKELTVAECIWETIVEVVPIIAEMFSLDGEEMITQIVRDNQRFEAMRRLAQTA